MNIFVQLYLSRSIVRQIGMDPSTAVGQTVTLGVDFLDIVRVLNIGGIQSDTVPI